jgi:hypothetical protein
MTMNEHDTSTPNAAGVAKRPAHWRSSYRGRRIEREGAAFKLAGIAGDERKTRAAM